MKGNPRIIDLLNQILTNELTAVNQYFLHARMCESWGFQRLWKKIRDESIGEMKHADKLIERILFLEGLPNLQRLGNVKVGENVGEILRLDLEVEHATAVSLNEAIELSRTSGDNGSRELLENLLQDTEEHASWLEAQLELIRQVGEPNYLARQIHQED